MKHINLDESLTGSPDAVARSVLVDVESMRAVALRFPAGYRLPPHHHPAANEIYSIVEGTAVLESGGTRADVGPGDVIHLPTGEQHTFVVGDRPLVILAVVAPNLPEHVMADGSIVGAKGAL